MATPLHPQEIFLLERYSSVEYFERMRDEFAQMVKVGDDALEAFMQKLPPDYRSWPRFEQPDATWGERVLPNLHWTLAGLNDGYIQLTHGDFGGLGMAGNVTTAFNGMRRDFSNEWMSKEALDRWTLHEDACSTPSYNIDITSLGGWCEFDLTTEYTDLDRGPLNPPSTWPIYRLNPAVRVRTGDKVPQDGVYLPDASASSPEFMVKGYEAWDANVTTDTTVTPPDWERRPTTWTLVERIANSGGGIPGAADPIRAGVRMRCLAGQPCPQAGYWFTPARCVSRRSFSTGESMPDVGGDYGVTIWQWDEAQ
jgi:hypothetical protein